MKLQGQGDFMSVCIHFDDRLGEQGLWVATRQLGGQTHFCHDLVHLVALLADDRSGASRLTWDVSTLALCSDVDGAQTLRRVEDMTSQELNFWSAVALDWTHFPSDSVEAGEFWHKDAKTAPFDEYLRKDDWHPSSDGVASSELLEKAVDNGASVRLEPFAGVDGKRFSVSVTFEDSRDDVQFMSDSLPKAMTAAFVSARLGNDFPPLKNSYMNPLTHIADRLRL